MTRVFVPKDVVALALGADRVARKISELAGARGAAVSIVRNGSRGMFFLEPMIEVETAARPHRLWAGDVGMSPSLFDAGFLTWLARIRCGSATGGSSFPSSSRRGSPLRAAASPTLLSLVDYAAHGGLRGPEAGP